MKSLILLVLFGMVCTVLANHDKRECEPNTHFREDCNVCSCSKRGRKTCTQIFCRPVPQQVCVPGSSFKQDCNTCICNDYGTAAGCTRIACRPEGSY